MTDDATGGGDDGLIAPHGGALVDRLVPQSGAADFMAQAATLPSLRLGAVAAGELRLIGCGAYSPLNGFMTRAEYEGVVGTMSLPGGTPWTLPVTLAVADDEARAFAEGGHVALRDETGELLGTIEVVDIFGRDPEREAREVYRTTDAAHPGVRAVLAEGTTLLGGPVSVLPNAVDGRALPPARTRALFRERGWTTVVAFQTRNPIHRAHEYLTKLALELVDGLLIHPLVGATKDDDVPADVRMRCYEVLVDGYYPPERVVLSTFPGAMRYAGPREAVFHGIVRRNYGCSHFIIGRDAAGVGRYYGTYDAQLLYEELGGAARLGYTAFKFEHTFFCSRCDGMASTRTCPHGAEDRLILSGTRVRELLTEGADLPAAFSRPEVAEILRAAYRAAAAAPA